MMQSVFRSLGLRQDEPSLAIVKGSRLVAGAGPSAAVLHAYRSGPGQRRRVVDTFLHGRDRSYTTADCLELVESADLVFQDWFFKAPYYPSPLTSPQSTFFGRSTSCRMPRSGK